MTLQINKNRDIAISSKYEDRWKKMEKNIYDITMINEENSAPLSLEGDFNFTQVNLSHESMIELHGNTKFFDGGFIHFERVYTVENGIMFRVSMGSFDRPEHLYIIVQESAYYYPSNPLKSKSNLKAHSVLNELFHG